MWVGEGFYIDIGADPISGGREEGECGEFGDHHQRTVKREKEENLHLHFPLESFIPIEKVKGGDLQPDCLHHGNQHRKGKVGGLIAPCHHGHLLIGTKVSPLEPLCQLTILTMP